MIGALGWNGLMFDPMAALESHEFLPQLRLMRSKASPIGRKSFRVAASKPSVTWKGHRILFPKMWPWKDLGLSMVFHDLDTYLWASDSIRKVRKLTKVYPGWQETLFVYGVFYLGLIKHSWYKHPDHLTRSLSHKLSSKNQKHMNTNITIDRPSPSLNTHPSS